MKTVLFITRFFEPENGAAALRATAFARYLSKRYRVVVLTTKPSYPDYRIKKEDRWTLWKKELVTDQLTVIRIPNIFLGKKFIFRLISDFSFMVGAFCASFRIKKIDHVLISSPPFFLGWTAVLIKFFRKVPYTIDIRDVYPDSLIEIGFLQLKSVIQVLKKWEKNFYNQASQILTVGKKVAERVQKRTHTPTQVVYNGVDIDWFDKYASKKNTEERKLFSAQGRHIIHVGNLGRMYEFDMMLDAAKSLQDKNFYFTFIGDGFHRERMEQRCKQEQISNVLFVGNIDSKRIPNIIEQADAGLVAMADIPLTEETIPNKVFEYLAGELPVFAHLRGESKEIFGNTLHYFDTSEQLISLIESISYEKNSAGNELVRSTYDRKNIIEQIKFS